MSMKSDLLGLDQHAVVAGLRAGVAAAGQRQQAGLSAGGAGPGVAAVALSGRVVAGWRTPGGGRGSRVEDVVTESRLQVRQSR